MTGGACAWADEFDAGRVAALTAAIGLTVPEGGANGDPSRLRVAGRPISRDEWQLLVSMSDEEIEVADGLLLLRDELSRCPSASAWRWHR